MTAGPRGAELRRILMTVDAVGGVWRYALDLADGLRQHGIETVFAVFGPAPSAAKVREAEAIGKLVSCDAPLDWMVEDEAALKDVPKIIADLAVSEGVDLIHLNLPSQAADLAVTVPAVVVSHSCAATWFKAVRGTGVPEPWQWQLALNARGLERADAVLAPSQSYAALMREVYRPVTGLQVVPNASKVPMADGPKQELVFAAARWWDDGKNGAVLDKAAADIRWPVVMVGSNSGPNRQYLPLENVQHHGELAHGEAMKLMAGAAIVVSPSVYEPFGLAALEAARAGAALVLADIPTYRELWGDTAVFFDPRDPKALAEAVNRLADDPSLRRELGERAQSRSLDFTSEAQALAVAQIYRQLLPATQSLTAAE
ncbi:glycosyltransferase family 4 protein [Rhizobium sp. NTR19]|uniref:Glycosyltransferase family 4 protein n=1 Tax=Neorhizobium turbinariae TaxID=2937795 RepID=A0ABT0ISP8_9HYPH|nr:glycosyltransferase family 4 protein [Neorhizobium turbinariae]MCK8780906.1 glycosyltransferase family 4 protein [Neorhizobium turbinariae]